LVPLLGVNVKTGADEDNPKYDHRYDRRLVAPSVKLPMQPWTINSQEGDNVGYNTWLWEITVAALQNSGKIPYFGFLQRYVIGRTADVLTRYREQMQQVQDGTFPPYRKRDLEWLLPDEEYFDIFCSKLRIAEELFGELAAQQR
jgi:hypothetical protein